MTEKTARILFAVGMTVSFPVVLAVMVSLVDLPSAPRSRPVRTVQPSQTTPRTPAGRPPKTADAAPTSSPRSRVAPAPDQPSAAAPKAIQPDPEAVQQLVSLKKGLKQEIDALKKDRDTMLVTLAQGLAQLPPADAAAELRPLDDELAALALRTLPADRRQPILAHLDPQRASQIQRRLKAGTVRK